MSFIPFNNKKTGIQIIGLPETIRAVDAIARDWDQMKMRILREASTFFVNRAKENVHKVSGDLARSISVDDITSESALVSAKTSYAEKEEKRQGIKLGTNTPHTYMKPAAADTYVKLPGMIKKEIDTLFAENKTT